MRGLPLFLSQQGFAALKTLINMADMSNWYYCPSREGYSLVISLSARRYLSGFLSWLGVCPVVSTMSAQCLSNLHRRVESTARALDAAPAWASSAASTGPQAASLTRDTHFWRRHDLLNISPVLTDAASAVVDDSFLRCFQSQPPDPWNWNVYLFPLWCIGVVVRYCILFPLRSSRPPCPITRIPGKYSVHLLIE